MTREQRKRQLKKQRAIWILAALLSLILLAAKAQVNTEAAQALHQHNIEIGVAR